MHRAHAESLRLNNMRLGLLLTLFFTLPCFAAQPLRVAVAANFQPTLTMLAERYERDSGHRLRISAGSTDASRSPS